MIDIFSTPMGKKVASVILGIGLATMFRRICNNSKCLVIKGPKNDQLNHYYKLIKLAINIILILLIALKIRFRLNLLFF